MEVELLEKALADALPSPARLEEHVVGQHHPGAAGVVQDRHDVLQEVELFVGGGELEVIALVVLPLGRDLPVLADHLVARLLAEGWVGQHHVEAVGPGGGERIALHHRAAAVPDAV